MPPDVRRWHFRQIFTAGSASFPDAVSVLSLSLEELWGLNRLPPRQPHKR